MEKEGTLVREDGSKPSPSKYFGDISSYMPYMLYFKGSIREEKTGLLAGFGVAICDQNENLLFQMKGSLHDSAITVLEAELTALKRGLTEAVGLGITDILINCNYQPVFELVMGRSTPEMASTALLMVDVQRIRKQLRSSIAVLMTENQTKFAYKHAMETLVSEISIHIPPAQKKHTCRICLGDDLEDDQMFVVALCGHQFCMECMKRYIEVGLLEGTALRCPQYYQCNSTLNITSCVNLLTPKLREMWERRIEEESVPAADRVYCPNPRCSTLMWEAGFSKSTDHDQEDGFRRCCVKCGIPFCINCKVAWHSNLSCDDYKRLGPYPTENDIKLISLANQEMWRRCGKCQHMIERLHGCSRITCRCGYSFCYKCGDKWKSGGCHHPELELEELLHGCEGVKVLIFFIFVISIIWLVNEFDH